MVTASEGVQTDLYKVVQPSCRSICHSSEPQTSTVCVSSPRPKCLGHRCSKHKQVGSHCLCLPSNGCPSQDDPKIRECNCLKIVIDPGWPGMPWFKDLVQLSTEIPLQLLVSTALLKQFHHYVFHNRPQHLNLLAWCLGVYSYKGFSVEVAEGIAAPQRSLTRTIYKSSGSYLRNGAEKIRWTSLLRL